jgi:hypothetical protein
MIAGGCGRATERRCGGGSGSSSMLAWGCMTRVFISVWWAWPCNRTALWWWAW